MTEFAGKTHLYLNLLQALSVSDKSAFSLSIGEDDNAICCVSAGLTTVLCSSLGLCDLC